MHKINVKQIVIGVLTYVPWLKEKLLSGGTGGSISARYCYSVWLRHLVMAQQYSLSTRPKAVAELGPGDSLGIGLAAMLSGADQYYAFDIVRYSTNERNIQILDELIELFKKRERIPDNSEFPEVKPFLESYEFPSSILTDEILQKNLASGRLEKIREALLCPGEKIDGILIAYVVPWQDLKVIGEEVLDMIYSQAVLEHVEDLPHTYDVLYRALKRGGHISNQIDFRAHGTATSWNGHWAYSNIVWKLIKGSRPYLINRIPYSYHIQLIEKCGFKIVCDKKFQIPGGIKRTHLQKQYKQLSEDDLATSSAFIQAVK
jgi:hypothetical protein